MKKALLIGLAVCLGVALAAPAMAIDWSATGYIAIGFMYDKNIPSGNGDALVVAMPVIGAAPSWGSPTRGGAMHDDWNDENAYVHTRGHLKLTARASEDLFGVFHFEMDSNLWGDDTAGRNSIGAWGTDQVAVEVKNVYIDFRVPPKLPVWIRAGMQTFLIRPGWFFVRDGAGLSGRIMIDPVKLMIRPMWGHMSEGSIWRSDDIDLYAVDMSLPIGPVKVGGFFLYQTDREVTLNQSDPVGIWWIGAYANAKVGPVNVMLDFAYDQGEYDSNIPNGDIDFQGWGLRGVADATFGIFNVGIGGLYFSGGDARDFATSPTDRDYDWFVRPGSAECGGTLDDSVIFGGWHSWHGPGVGHVNTPQQWQSLWNSGIRSPATGATYAFDPYYSGIWGLRAFGTVQPLNWLQVHFQVAYWGDTTDAGDTWGSAYDNLAGWYEDNDEIGWEFDIGATVNVYKNLTFKTAFGYLVAGSALDQWNPNAADNDDPSDPWAWHSSLAYTF